MTELGLVFALPASLLLLVLVAYGIVWAFVKIFEVEG